MERCAWIWNNGKVKKNLWGGIEAIAELASYTIAYPGQYEMKMIEDQVSIVGLTKPTQSMSLINDTHEYDMACFIQYLLTTSNTTFADMWISVAGSSKSGVNVKLEEFFGKKIDDFTIIESAFLDFWRGVITDSRMPKMQTVTNIIDPMILGQDQHSIEYAYKCRDSFTQEFYATNMVGYSVNMPRRIFCVEYTGGDEAGDAYITKIEGAPETKNLVTMRQEGGYSWDYIYKATSDTSEGYRLYEMTNREQMLLIGLQNRQKDSTSSVKISEIDATCDPKEIEVLVANKEYSINLKYKDIFPCEKCLC